MAAALNAKTKELDPNLDAPPMDAAMDTSPPVDQMPPEEEEVVEPYGAQILRRVHQDHSIIMGEYHDMLQLCDQPEVEKHVQELLGEIDSRMTKIEELFGSIDKYSSLDGLEGAMGPEDYETKEEGAETPEGDEQAAAADSGNDEETPPEEVAEGMKEDVKNLKGTVETKHLCSKCSTEIQTKSMCPCGKENCDCDKKSVKCMCGKKDCKCGKKDVSKVQTKDMPENEKPEEAVEATSPTADMAPPAEAVSPEQTPPAEAVEPVEPEVPKVEESPYHKALEPHEKLKVGEASGFLKSISTEMNFDDDHRMKSYHYWKTLEPMGFAEMDQAGDQVNVTTKDLPVEKPEMDQVVDLSEAKKNLWKLHRKSIHEASQFMRSLSREKAFGDEHRMKSMAYHKALDPIASYEDEPEMAETQDNPTEPGELGEKDFELIKNMKEVSDKQYKDLAELSRKTAKLFAVLQ